MTTPGFNQELNQELIDEILGERSELALYGNAAQLGRGRGFENFFQRHNEEFQRMFQAAIGGQLTSGQLPTLSAQNFFNPSFLLNEYFGRSPQDRGMGIAQFAPRVRQIF